jgi:hypothetical protein
VGDGKLGDLLSERTQDGDQTLRFGLEPCPVEISLLIVQFQGVSLIEPNSSSSPKSGSH